MSKKMLFQENEVALSNLCKAISHPGRIRVLKLLLLKNEQTCQQIVDQIPLSQSTVSQHLSELRKYGLIKAKNYKTSVIYSIEKENLSKFQRMFTDVFYTQLITTVKQASLF